MLGRKTIYLLLILALAYIYLVVNYPSEKLKPAAYGKLIGYYSSCRSKTMSPHIIYNSGLRNINIDTRNPRVMAIIPDENPNYSQIMERFLAGPAQAIVECSGLDTWHSSAAGLRYLTRINRKAYRVVIFDGGHHLPTLGMNPDIIIIPEFRGYAAHGYMQDGIKVAAVLDMLKASHMPAVVATVPRFRLVKTEDSLSRAAQAVIRQTIVREGYKTAAAPQCRDRISKYRGQMYIYVNDEYARDMNRLLENCRSLDTRDVNNVYVAFDYGCIPLPSAEDYAANLAEQLQVRVKIVNEPVKVSDLLFKLGNE